MNDTTDTSAVMLKLNESALKVEYKVMLNLGTTLGGKGEGQFEDTL